MCLMFSHYSHMQQYASSKLCYWAMPFDIGQTIISIKQTNDFNITHYEWQQSSIMHGQMITKWTWQISKTKRI
jgi:hypothetical protein